MDLILRKKINNQTLLERFRYGTTGGMWGGDLYSNGGWNQNAFDVGMSGWTNNNIDHAAVNRNLRYNMPNEIAPLPNGGYGSSPIMTAGELRQATSNIKLPTNNGPFNSRPSSIGFDLIGNGIASGIQGTTQMVLQHLSAEAETPSQNLLEALSGTTTVQGSGFAYDRQNDIDRSGEFKKLSSMNTMTTAGMTGTGAAAGAAVGSIFPGLGTVIGAAAGAVTGLVAGLFGAKSRRERLRKRIFNALLQINRNNNFAQSSALTDYLDTDYARNHTNTYDNALYTANRGKDLKQPTYD